jgi:STOP protein
MSVMSTKCPLSDPSIDIVPTNYHLVGNCLCSFCTCGKHLCPRMNIKDPYPKGTFTTKYMSEYKNIKFDVPVKPEPKLYYPNKQKMDLLTSNQDDYKSLKLKPTSPIKPNDYTSPKKPSLSNITANSYNFPNWGANNIGHEKRWDPPLRTTELPFKGQSSYGRSYSPVLPADTMPYQTDYSKSTPYQTRLSLGPKARLDDRTTYSEKMKDFSSTQFNARIKVKPAKAEAFHASPSHFSTTANAFYKVPDPKIDPRQLRILLQSRGN